MPKNELPEIIYYSDPLHDEFSVMELHADKIEGDYIYIRDKSKFKSFLRGFWYFCVAKPIAKIYLKASLHHELVGRWKIKRFKGSSIFVYGNHTQIIGDALIPSFVLGRRKVNVIVHPNNLKVPGIGKFLPFLGALPLPSNSEANEHFQEAIKTRVEQKQAVVIYPEAHIWPFYTGIRPFVADSFIYPTKMKLPVFCFTNTYHKHGKKGVRIRTYIDGPFFADENLPQREAIQELRNEVYNAMSERSALSDYEVIKYVRKSDD